MARFAIILALLMPFVAGAAELTAHRTVELRGNLRSKIEATGQALDTHEQQQSPETMEDAMISGYDDEEEEDAAEDKPALVLASNSDQNDEMVDAQEKAQEKAGNSPGVATGEGLPPLASFNSVGDLEHDDDEDADEDEDIDLLMEENENGGSELDEEHDEDLHEGSESLLEVSHSHNVAKKTALKKAAAMYDDEEDADDFEDSQDMEDEDFDLMSESEDGGSELDEEDDEDLHEDDEHEGAASLLEVSRSHTVAKTTALKKAAAMHDDVDADDFEDSQDMEDEDTQDEVEAKKEQSGDDLNELVAMAEKAGAFKDADAEQDMVEHAEDEEDNAGETAADDNSDDKDAAILDQMDGTVALAQHKEGKKAAAMATKGAEIHDATVQDDEVDVDKMEQAEQKAVNVKEQEDKDMKAIVAEVEKDDGADSKATAKSAAMTAQMPR